MRGLNWLLRRREQRVTQGERMRSASNDWEADPWNATDEVADAQLAGFRKRAGKSITWFSIRDAGPSLFGIEIEKLHRADVKFHATQDGEDMILMQLDWHGYPDPPEWRLATRPSGMSDAPWDPWGFFADLPEKWIMPDA
jgi:hypothetical protein